MIGKKLRLAAGTAALSLGLAGLVSVPAQAAGCSITMWTDSQRAPSVRSLVGSTYKTCSFTVVVKDFGAIRDDLKTVAADSAPDLIMGAHDWTGELAANGLVVGLNLSAATKKAFPSYAVGGFTVGRTTYGVPVAIENVAMISNVKLVPKAPANFAALSTAALALKKAGKVTVPFAVPQGSGGDAYHMYPLFSGLGGYIFGKNASGGLDKYNDGLANKTFIKNSTIIDGWNKSGLINSKVDYGTGKDAFTKGKAPFWITGPWEMSSLRTMLSAGAKLRIGAVPNIVKGINPVPFLGVQGILVTKYADTHGVGLQARSLATEFFTSATAQARMSSKNGRFPANLSAASKVTDAMLKAFGKAGAGGVPMPNIPEMGVVWGQLGGAWVKSTKGVGATKASVAFTAARNAIDAAIP